MTYVSKTMNTLYELNNFVGDYSASLATFQTTNSLLDNASIAFHEVGARITALFLSVVGLLFVPFFIIPDLFTLNLRIMCERDLLSPAIFKVNAAFGKAVALGLAAPFLAIISPKYVYKENMAHLILRRYIAEIFVQIPENVQALARQLNVNLTRLNQVNAALANWREELAHYLAATLPTISRYQFEGANDPNFITFNFLLYREAFRMLLRAHFSEADVQSVMPNVPRAQNLREGAQPRGLFGQAFALTDWILDARSWRHLETQRQFRLIMKRALKDIRAELIDQSKYEQLKEDIRRIKANKKSESEQTAEIENLLKKQFIFPAPAETYEVAVARAIERTSAVKYEVQQMKKKNNKVTDEQLNGFLASKGITLRNESIDQVMKRLRNDLESIRFKVIQIRSKAKTETELEKIEPEIVAFLRTKSIFIGSNETSRTVIAKKFQALDEIQHAIEEMKKSSKDEKQLGAYLATKSITQKKEVPEQACDRVLESYKIVKDEVQKLILAKKDSAEIEAYLKAKSITMLPAETALVAIEKAKAARTFTSEEIATMDVSPYAAMFDRAIFRIIEMATLEYTLVGHETLVLVQYPDDYPEDLRLSKENNIFELFEAFIAIHDEIRDITTENMKVLRWLLMHKDLDPTQIFDHTDKNVPISTHSRPCVVIKEAKLIKRVYNKIIEVRQNLIDRRLRAEGGWGNDFAQAFQAS